MNGFVGSNPPKNQRPAPSESIGDVKTLKKGNVAPAAGLVAHIDTMSHHHLGYKERVVIKTLLDKKFSITEIAAELGCHRSTIYRELRRHKSRGGYDSDQAGKWLSRRRHVASSRPRRLGAELISFPNACLGMQVRETLFR